MTKITEETEQTALMEFCAQNEAIIVKALRGMKGKDIEKFEIDAQTDYAALLQQIRSMGDCVAEELVGEGYENEKVDTYLGLYKEVTPDIDGIRFLKEKLNGVLDANCAEELETIISSVDAVKTANFKLVFDPTLVRGMSYYTGPIFEISIDGFGGSVGGGGRYDEMIGRFTGQNTPACGFSIGFERIVMLLLEKDYQIPTKKEKKAYMIEKGIEGEALMQVFKEAEEERKNGVQINIVMMKKNKKFQKDQLATEGYTEIKEFFRS